jgi:hypothetical protein
MRPAEPVFHNDMTVLASWKCKGLLLSSLDYEGEAHLIGPEELLVSTGPVALVEGYLGGLVNTWMKIWEVEVDWHLIINLLEQTGFPSKDHAIASGLYLSTFAKTHGAPKDAKKRIRRFLAGQGLPRLSVFHAIAFWIRLLPLRWSPSALPGHEQEHFDSTARFMMRAYPLSHDWLCLRHGVYQPRGGFGAERKVAKPIGWVRPPGKQPYTETGT